MDQDGWDHTEEELVFDFGVMESPVKKQRASESSEIVIVTELPEDYAFPLKLTYNGYVYSKKTISKNKEKGFYNCPSYRAPHFCKANVVLGSDGSIISRDNHTCKRNGNMAAKKIGEVYDATEEMKKMIAEGCLEDASKGASEVAKRIFEQTTIKYEGN
jgi:FLYWCH zinc finger domain